MSGKSLIVVGTLAVALSVGGCALDPQGAPKQTVGTLGGAVAGGLLGAQVGGGRGQLIATATGAVLGAWLGSEIGSSLDRADQLHAERATYQALEHNPSNQPARWENPDSGHYGTVTPVRTYETAGRTCREFEHDVWIDGRREIAYGQACRDPDGRWQII
jgi:surface antigen